jgi:hypothetical protein
MTGQQLALPKGLCRTLWRLKHERRSCPRCWPQMRPCPCGAEDWDSKPACFTCAGCFWNTEDDGAWVA